MQPPNSVWMNGFCVRAKCDTSNGVDPIYLDFATLGCLEFHVGSQLTFLPALVVMNDSMMVDIHPMGFPRAPNNHQAQ